MPAMTKLQDDARESEVSDLIQRLRTRAAGKLTKMERASCFEAEAADYIEFLQAELAEIKRHAEDSTEYVLAQINQELRAELAGCEPFLQERETPAECIARNRDGASQALKLLVDEKRKSESLSEELAAAELERDRYKRALASTYIDQLEREALKGDTEHD